MCFAGHKHHRVMLKLRHCGFIVNHTRVARIIRECGLQAHIVRRFAKTTYSNHDLPVFPVLYRDVIPMQPDKVWVGKPSYIRTLLGFAYSSALLNTCSHKVVGYAIPRRVNTKLTLAALHASNRNRRASPGTCIHHPDKGSQYANQRYR